MLLGKEGTPFHFNSLHLVHTSRLSLPRCTAVFLTAFCLMSGLWPIFGKAKNAEKPRAQASDAEADPDPPPPAAAFAAAATAATAANSTRRVTGSPLHKKRRPSGLSQQGVPYSVDANLSPAVKDLGLRERPVLESPPRQKSQSNAARRTVDLFGLGSSESNNEPLGKLDELDDDEESVDDGEYLAAKTTIGDEQTLVEIDDKKDDDPTDFHDSVMPALSSSDDIETSDSKQPRVPSNEEDFARTLADHYAKQQGAANQQFSFASLRRPPQNAKQSNELHKYLSFCLDIFMIVYAAGFVFSPTSILSASFDYMHKHLCINTKLSYVYWLFGKIGCTGNGFNRLLYYATHQYKYIANELVQAARPVISIDTLPNALQITLTNAMIKGLAAFVLFKGVPVPRLTIRQAVRFEMVGLPFATQLFFFAMITDYDKGIMLSGAIKLVGCLRRLYLATLESGAQVKFNADGAQHEAVNYTFLGWFFYEMPRVVAEVKRFFDLFPEEERRQLLEQGWTMNTALLTWPTGKLSDAPPLLASVHILFAEAIFGIGNWVDALPFPPVADPKKIQQCFDSSKYLPIQGLEAFRRIRKYVRRISRNGGFGFIDVNTVVVGLLKDLKPDQLEVGEANYMNIESLEEFFCSIMGWVRFFRSPILPIVVLKKPRLDNGMFRLLFLYNPFCYATFWNPKCTKVSLKRVRSMARTVMQCQWLLMVVTVLTTENHDLTFDVMDQPITDNFMFIWHIFAHWAIFLHIPAAVCALVFKQFLILSDNLFDSRHTTQLRDASFDSRLVGKQARVSRNFKTKKSSVRRFSTIHRYVACILSGARNRQELKTPVLRVIDMLKTDDPTDWLSTSSTYSTKNKRIESIKTEGLIQGALLGEIMEAFLEDRPNVGNPLANYSPSKEETDANSMALAKVALSGEWHTCQSTINYDGDESYDQRKAGNGFTPPAHGVKLIAHNWGEDRRYSFQGKDDTALQYAYFDKNKFVEKMVAPTIEGRTGKDTRKKNDKSNKGIMFSDYKMEQPLVPPKGRGKGARWARMGPTHQGITMFRLVWRKEGTEEQRKKELKKLLAENGFELD
mmetsp:Transcript_3526/g.7878  ORF Transcript_3526/g.7878 Transcript_3526/m.7878 type:complete len:1074 (+) Transcript_3526:454-3675(+)